MARDSAAARAGGDQLGRQWRIIQTLISSRSGKSAGVCAGYSAGVVEERGEGYGGAGVALDWAWTRSAGKKPPADQ